MSALRSLFIELAVKGKADKELKKIDKTTTKLQKHFKKTEKISKKAFDPKRTRKSAITIERLEKKQKKLNTELKKTDVSTRKFKQLNRELGRTERQMIKVNRQGKKLQGMRGRMGGFGKFFAAGAITGAVAGLVGSLIQKTSQTGQKLKGSLGSELVRERSRSATDALLQDRGIKRGELGLGGFSKQGPVSYTHLTLPTNREV